MITTNKGGQTMPITISKRIIAIVMPINFASFIIL